MPAYLHDSWKVATDEHHKSLIGFPQSGHYSCRMNPLKEEVGRRLKNAREVRGLTLQEVVAEVKNGLTVSRLSNWENGIRLADIDFVKRLAPVYLTNAAYLLTLDEFLPVSDQARNVAKAFDSLSEKQREAVITMIESYGVPVDRPPPPPALQVQQARPKQPLQPSDSAQRAEQSSGSSSSE